MIKMTGNTFYPTTVWCHDLFAVNCTQKEGSHKLKYFNETLKVIRDNLEFRIKKGKKRPMSKTHGDFVKFCAKEGFIRVKQVSTKESDANIFTKPLPFKSHRRVTHAIINV